VDYKWGEGTIFRLGNCLRKEFRLPLTKSPLTKSIQSPRFYRDEDKNMAIQRSATKESGTRGNRQQSGHPGAGKGRKEDVRGSGIYPAFGPLPPGPVPIRTRNQIGRRRLNIDSDR
jgi:hypothetical protein